MFLFSLRFCWFFLHLKQFFSVFLYYLSLVLVLFMVFGVGGVVFLYLMGILGFFFSLVLGFCV